MCSSLSLGVTLKGSKGSLSSEPPNLQYLYALYDFKQMKVFTEALVVQKSTPHQNIRVLFTDLNTRDTDREKVFLVCYVIRIGNLHPEKEDKEKDKHTSPCDVKRAYGVAALDITLFLNGKLEVDDDDQYFMPFVLCEKDNLENTLKRLISSLKDISSQKSAGMYVSLKFHCGDNKTESVAVAMTNTFIARKMGFPEIILPGDVRNDLYVTLVNAEFKSSDKTIQVTVQVCTEAGVILKDVVLIGVGVEPQSRYDSLVYYHEDKPRWCETFKLAIPIEEFKHCHLKITYKHRSSAESKGKVEKPFGLSFVKLMQKNGTTLPDVTHELLIDHKKYDVQGTDTSYLSLPCSRSELNDTGSKPSHISGLSLHSRDVLVIATNVCSTKLTQNVDLLGLLNWTSDTSRLDYSLRALMKLDGEEIVKFLQDVLDALFDILVQNNDDANDFLVFECLLYIIGLVLDRKYQHFQPVLDLYLEESFSATLAYEKLINILASHIQRGSDKDLLLKTMKCLQYLFRIVVRSRLLFATLYEGRGEEAFCDRITELLTHIGNLMKLSSGDCTLLVQGACLKYLPTIFPDLLLVCQPVPLSELFIQVVQSVPGSSLSKQRLMTLSGVVHSQLFTIPQSRRVLLPPILTTVKQFLEANQEVRSSVEMRNKTKSFAKIEKVLGASFRDPKDLTEEVELCVEILSDIMGFLWKSHTVEDIEEIMLIVLRSVIQSVIRMERDTNLCHLVAIMLSIFRHMTGQHYESYIAHLTMSSDKLDFLMEILLAFKDLIARPVYPNDWTEMILLQNAIIFKALRFFSHTVRDYFSRPFENQAWANWFHCACVFLTQPALQLENFSPEKRARILARYKDMRRDAAFEIRTMWFNLRQNRVFFVPSLVGMFLEVSLTPEPEVRSTIIPIFFNMMECEFYTSRDREGNFIKANFSEFENEMIFKLDSLIEGGLGDCAYRTLFQDILGGMCDDHSTLGEPGGAFIRTASRQIDALLEYRSLVKDANPEIRMRCTVRLLDFYAETPRKELYLRYVHKLVALHLATDDYTEAAHTLELHAKLLAWNNTSLPQIFKSSRHPKCVTHKQLKEALYLEAIEYFDKGKMWESALELCKELVSVYETEAFDYIQLPELLRRMAGFYDSIQRQLRPEPEYFRVAYYGRGFPTFLQNKVFVYRGKEYERLTDFSSRALNFFPNAELMNKLTPPGEEITESSGQYVQINKVDPIMCAEDQRKFADKPISEQIIRYYRCNRVQKFKYSRPYRKSLELSNGSTTSLVSMGNEFASLWLERKVLVISSVLPGILRWFPVISTETFHISPLRCAIETMESTNRSLKELILSHKNDSSLALHPLSMKLNGIVDAAVNGGIVNYETAFFSSDYIHSHPDDTAHITKLRDLIASQIPLLEVGIAIHAQRIPPALGPFHKRLEHCFQELRQAVEAKYGKQTCDIRLDTESAVKLRRHASVDSAASPGISHKSSSSISSSITGLAGPVIADGVRLFGTFNSRKDKKERKRRAVKTESKCSLDSNASSLWYTVGDLDTSSGSGPVIELTEQLVATRPLRSEVEKDKRLSREASHHSASSEEGELALPPNLPLKMKEKEADYSNGTGDEIRGNPSYLHGAGKIYKAPIPNPTEEEAPEPELPLEPHSAPLIVEDISVDIVSDDVPPCRPPKKPHMKMNF
ncbi:hypothetical protein M8J76_011912 [Diaphorina citri]|nr:hypothetical protein M8J76_011912 [Diaphorina citri]